MDNETGRRQTDKSFRDVDMRKDGEDQLDRAHAIEGLKEVVESEKIFDGHN